MSVTIAFLCILLLIAIALACSGDCFGTCCERLCIFFKSVQRMMSHACQESDSYLASKSLRLIDSSSLDLRNDADIVAEILSDRPVTSTKNVWAFWDKGWDALQPWRKRNVVSWARRLGRDWHIRVLDTVPGSPRHVANFVSHGLLPAAILENKMTGRFAGQHSADFARLPLLIVHGGVWLDVSFFLLRHLDDICWNAICDSNNPHELSMVRTTPIANTLLINGFIATLPGNQFLKAWHTLFLEIWKDHDTCKGVSRTPLFNEITKFESNPVWTALLGPGATTEFLNDYWGAAVCCSRLISVDDPSSQFKGNDYFRKHIRIFDTVDVYPQHAFFVADGFDENAHIELLALPRSEPPHTTDPLQTRAERLVMGILADGIIKCMSQGPWDPSVRNLAAAWTKGLDEDKRPGTWAAYLRWGSVHLESTKPLQIVPQEAIEKPPSQGGTPRKIWKVGLLEPIVPGITEYIEA